MGFWDIVGGIGKEVGRGLKDMTDKAKEAKGRYEHYDDARLKILYRSASGMDKMGIGLVLKDRGYKISNGRLQD